MRRVFHIVVCLAAFLLAGCVEPIAPGTGQRIVLKMYCEDPVQTKSEPGLDAYNENLITKMDIFFYSGEPGLNQTAVLYSHFDLDNTTTGSADFQINVSSGQIQSLFPDGVDKITVFAVANYAGDELLVASEADLSHTTLAELYNKSVKTEFVHPSKISQDDFMMRGLQTLDLNGVDGREKEVVCTGTVDLERYASKLTVAVHIPETSEIGFEKWHPMRENMEVYLVDGVNTVKLSGEQAPSASAYFDYSKARRRFAVRNSQTGEVTDLIEPTIVDEGTPQEKKYYNTYPMYMYPQTWDYGSSDKNAGTCEPHLKLILPWYREEDVDHNIYSNQRQCYYKIMLPDSFDKKFEMNNWYHLDIDIDILGALTDENAVPISPGSSFIVPWQNVEQKINHNVNVGEAHYLFVERDSIVLRNYGELTIPYLTSHPVQMKEGSIRATRPYYGTESEGTSVYEGAAIIRKAQNHDIYPDGMLYLDYIDGQTVETSTTTVTVQGIDYSAVSVKINKFEFLVVEALASVIVRHELVNDYTKVDFDYSPYSIFFTLEHGDADRIEKTVQVEQYPAIYIDRKTNSDAKTVGGTTTLYPKDNSTKQSDSQYWGYAFVDGGAYWPANLDPEDPNSAFTRGIAGSTTCRWVQGARQNRRDQNGNNADMFFKIPSTNDALYIRQEYQWRTLWYTGGSLDMFRINVTALPAGSDFVIGDPRTHNIRDLNSDYKKSFNSRFYDSEGAFHGGILPEPDPALRDGFTISRALYPEGDYRTLMFYYPTDDADRTKTMLAPSYRFSSKFSGIEFSGVNNTKGITKEYATYRCATYQEDGYPAGRWRLPTKGEIRFAAMLSANKVFAVLFNVGGKYWSSTGAILVQDGNVKDDSATDAMLRCVYDTWYWGDEQLENRNEFVWGDRKR